MEAALDRADRYGIGHKERLEPRFDREQSGEAFQHRHQSLSKRRANGSVPPFPA